MPTELEQTLQRLAVFLREVVEPLAFGISCPLSAEVAVISDWRATPPPPQIAAGLPFKPVNLGFRWGPKWATAWFRVRGEVPASMAGSRVALRFSTATEALLWKSVKGGFEPVQGFDVNRDSFVLFEAARGGEPVELLIEAACNHPFGVTGFEWDDAEVHARWESDNPGRFERCELAVADQRGWELRQAFAFLLGLVKELPADSPRTGDLVAALNRASSDISLGQTREALAILTNTIERPSAGSATLCHAAGHAHLDTAWLWPVRETKRKCLRTFSNQLRLMERFPGYSFLCSQAVHYAWVEQQAPNLFAQIKERVLEGRWEAGGAMWVEPDANCVSGESFIRQILHGTAYWSERFGPSAQQSFLYLPDTFGFSGALPQIMKLAGLRTFITNKLHWNATNTFPYTTFVWKGIDGTEVLAHNTPGKDYNATNTPRELIRGEKTHRNKDLPTALGSEFVPARWLQPFGYGDGGGGPTDWSIRFAEYAADCDGLPRVTLTRANDFCKELLEDRSRLRAAGTDFPLVFGELYLELHRGTFTSQAWIKLANFDAEESLRLAELVSSVPGPAGRPLLAQGAAAQLDEAWKLVLLNQFHDILPGSSIGWVYEDAREDYKRVDAISRPLIASGLQMWASGLDAGSARDPLFVLNPGSHARSGILEVEGSAVYADSVPALGIAVIDRSQAPNTQMVSVEGSRLSDGLTLSNGIIRATVNDYGQIVHLERIGTGAVFDTALNTLAMHEDRPAMWDAWDIDLSYELSRTDVLAASESFRIVEASHLRAIVERSVKLSPHSRMKQRFILNAGASRVEVHSSVEWNESHKLLRAYFPTGLTSPRCRGGIQFGSLDRPTHRNTSQEKAMFEFVAHRWLDLSQPGKGLAVLTRAKFGHSSTEGLLGLSLLRAPKHPDPNADMGTHHFTYALMPHEGDWAAAGVHREAEDFAAPMLAFRADKPASGNGVRQWAPVSISTEGACDVQVSAFKSAEAGEGLILRLFECKGGSGRVRVGWNFACGSAQVVDALERPYHDPPLLPNPADPHSSTFPIRPFQIVTLRVIAK